MPTEKALDPRLESAVPYVTRGGRAADIGTDHAYLPIELIRRGISDRALACDINEGPLERAEANIRAAGMTDRIGWLLTDGLHGVEAFDPTDVLIFGMGGELIAKILSEAPWVRERKVNLILQPMTKPEALRAWLAREGFSVLHESLTKTDRYYQTVHARFTGEREDYTAEELLLGKRILSGDSPHLIGLIQRTLDVLTSATDGKRRGGLDVEEDLRLIESLESRLKQLREEEA